MSRKKVLPPGQTLLHPITSAVEPIDLAGLFSTRQPLELELGCGDGSFTLQYALANPGRNIVARWSGCSAVSPSLTARGIVPD